MTIKEWEDLFYKKLEIAEEAVEVLAVAILDLEALSEEKPDGELSDHDGLKKRLDSLDNKIQVLA